MKSALLAAIFGITGGAAILLAAPAGEKAPVIKIQLPKSSPDYGEPVVPQIEEVPPQEVLGPEPLDHYSVPQAKTEKPAPRLPQIGSTPDRNSFNAHCENYSLNDPRSPDTAGKRRTQKEKRFKREMARLVRKEAAAKPASGTATAEKAKS